MYAIVEIAGQQFKVEKERKVYVHRLPQEEGADVTFEKVLLVDNDGVDQCWYPRQLKALKLPQRYLSTSRVKK